MHDDILQLNSKIIPFNQNYNFVGNFGAIPDVTAFFLCSHLPNNQFLRNDYQSIESRAF